MTLTFTARTVARLKPTQQRAEYFDAATPGLSLRVTARGAKTWTVLYRHRGRLRRLTLGSAIVLGLAEARARARRTRRDAHDGADPATEKQQHRTAGTFADLATEYIERLREETQAILEG